MVKDCRKPLQLRKVGLSSSKRDSNHLLFTGSTVFKKSIYHIYLHLVFESRFVTCKLLCFCSKWNENAPGNGQCW